MSGTPQAFLSYTRLDDQGHGGGITALRAALELEVRIVTGESFDIFQDVDGIAFGEHWPKRLDQALAASRFMIPVLSPAFFKSEPCRDELRKFLAHEQAAGRDDLILPIYLVEAAVLERPHLTAADELATAIAQRQRWDWRPHAFSPATEPTVRRALRELAAAIGGRLDQEVVAPPPSVRPPAPTLVFSQAETGAASPPAGDPPATSTPLPRSNPVDALEAGAAPSREPEPTAPMPPADATGLAGSPAAPPESTPTQAPEPPSLASPEPNMAPDNATTVNAGVTAGPADFAPSPDGPASAPAALDIPTAPPQRPDPAPEPPAAPPQHRQPLPAPTGARAESSSVRTTGPRRLAVLALVGLGAVGLGIYAFAGRHQEPVPPIAAPESAPATPTAPEPAPAPPPAPAAAEPSPADVETALGLSRGDWQAAQLRLKSQGFDAGAADGVVGAKTRQAQAVGAWQARVTGYLATGQLDQIGRSSRTAIQDFTDTLKDGSPCTFCPEMVVIPAGSFTMGSPANEAERYDDEGPQRKVTFAQPFAIGRYEVTFEQWDACMASGGCAGDKPDDRGWGRGSRPVINVSWNDAQDFLFWLSHQTREVYRLPTEAEWEYAARAGTTTPFWTGDTISTAQANYDGNYSYGAGTTGVYRGQTVSVEDSAFPANPFGLFHVHGNISEWVRDCYADSYDGAPSDGQVAVARNDCPERVLRGGSWISSPWYLRSASRFRNAPGTRGDFFDSRFTSAPGTRDHLSGFRVARMLTP